MSEHTNGGHMKLLPHAEMIRLAKAIAEAEETLNEAIAAAHEAGMRTRVEIQNATGWGNAREHWVEGAPPIVNCLTVFPVEVERRRLPGPPMAGSPIRGVPPEGFDDSITRTGRGEPTASGIFEAYSGVKSHLTPIEYTGRPRG